MMCCRTSDNCTGRTLVFAWLKCCTHVFFPDDPSTEHQNSGTVGCDADSDSEATPLASSETDGHGQDTPSLSSGGKTKDNEDSGLATGGSAGDNPEAICTKNSLFSPGDVPGKLSPVIDDKRQDFRAVSAVVHASYSNDSFLPTDRCAADDQETICEPSSNTSDDKPISKYSILEKEKVGKVFWRSCVPRQKWKSIVYCVCPVTTLIDGKSSVLLIEESTKTSKGKKEPVEPKNKNHCEPKVIFTLEKLLENGQLPSQSLTIYINLSPCHRCVNEFLAFIEKAKQNFKIHIQIFMKVAAFYEIRRPSCVISECLRLSNLDYEEHERNVQALAKLSRHGGVETFTKSCWDQLFYLLSQRPREYEGTDRQKEDKLMEQDLTLLFQFQGDIDDNDDGQEADPVVILPRVQSWTMRSLWKLKWWKWTHCLASTKNSHQGVSCVCWRHCPVGEGRSRGLPTPFASALSNWAVFSTHNKLQIWIPGVVKYCMLFNLLPFLCDSVEW